MNISSKFLIQLTMQGPGVPISTAVIVAYGIIGYTALMFTISRLPVLHHGETITYLSAAAPTADSDTDLDLLQEAGIFIFAFSFLFTLNTGVFDPVKDLHRRRFGFLSSFFFLLPNITSHFF